MKGASPGFLGRPPSRQFTLKKVGTHQGAQSTSRPDPPAPPPPTLPSITPSPLAVTQGRGAVRPLAVAAYQWCCACGTSTPNSSATYLDGVLKSLGVSVLTHFFL